MERAEFKTRRLPKCLPVTAQPHSFQICTISHRLSDFSLVELAWSVGTATSHEVYLWEREFSPNECKPLQVPVRINMTGKSSQIVRAGERTNAQGKPVSNRVLLSTPDNEYRLMRPYLKYIDLPSHLSLHEPTQTIEFVYFLNRGMVSQVVVTKDGRTVEVGVVGNEGYVGAGLAVGLSRSSVREVLQIAGDGFQLRGNDLERIMRSAPQLRMILGKHTGLQGMQIAQTAGCNRLHNIQQRLSRWLLMAQDRAESPILAITHDFIATMMGTDRSTVSLAAAALQKRGILEYVPGAVNIVNRRKLEKSACECYSVIQQFENDLGLK
jgi:CRP-like cAMP-binding protein